MNKATFCQRGETLDYKNATNQTSPAGSILEIGTIIGVAAADIEPGAIGAVHVTGVFEMPKTDETEIAMGAAVYFDGEGITTSATAPETTEETPAAAEETVTETLTADTDYTYDDTSNKITLTTAPADGAVITASYNNGTDTVTDTFNGDGTETEFTLTDTCSSDLTVTVATEAESDGETEDEGEATTNNILVGYAAATAAAAASTVYVKLRG